MERSGVYTKRTDSNIVSLDFGCSSSSDRSIDVSKVRSSSYKLREGLIAPRENNETHDVYEDHAAEPIKNMEDINRISTYLISKKRYRDNMLFVVGINFGLRIGDLLQLRFTSIINDDCTFRDRFAILEKKTKDTRKRKKNRYITVNRAVMDAVTLYLEHSFDVKLSDYMFRSESNRSRNSGKPMHRASVDVILKGIASDLGLGCRMSTHTLRKTFAYHQMVMSHNDPRKLLLLQKMFGHATAAQTLDYIGITEEEIDEAYKTLNLGSSTCNYLVDGTVTEEVEVG